MPQRPRQREPSRSRSAALRDRLRSHPGAVRRVTAWFVVSGLLGLLGFGAADRLHSFVGGPSDSASGRATAAQERTFGRSSPLLVVLKGPSRELERDGPRVARALAAVPSVSVLSPWNSTSIPTLRPRRGEVLLLLQVRGSPESATDDVAPRLRRTLASAVKPPLRARMTGYVDIANAIHHELVGTLRTAEMVSIPLLMLVLLLMLGTPVAAAIPGILGGTLLGASSGAIDLMNRVIPLDATALSLSAGISLGLGVDYSLLVLSRYREARARLGDDELALAEAVRTAGRTVRFAALVVGGAMVVALLLVPYASLVSATAGAVVAVLLSLVAATLVLPSLVLLSSPWIERWRIAPAFAGSRAWARIAERVVRRPVTALVLGGLFMLLLAAPLLALKTGPPGSSGLSPASKERRDTEVISRELGPGWAAPYQVLVEARDGTIADGPRLSAVSRFTAGIRELPRVEMVLGPDALGERTSGLARAPEQLAQGSAQARRAVSGLVRLRSGTSAAAAGGDQLAGGLRQATGGTRQLLAGASTAHSGAGELRTGLARAHDGSAALLDGLRRLRLGTTRLSRGARALASGADRLSGGSAFAAAQTRKGLTALRELERRLGAAATGLDQLRQPVSIATSSLRDARGALDRMLATSKLDPEYPTAARNVSQALAALTGFDPQTGRQVAAGYRGLDQALADASTQAAQGAAGVHTLVTRLRTLSRGLDRLAAGAERVDGGAGRLAAGARDVGAGGTQLAGGGDALARGLAALGGGAAQLDPGLGALVQGLARLDDGLRFASTSSDDLAAGLARIRTAVARGLRTARRTTRRTRDLGALERLLASGYARLAAISTAPPKERRAASFGVNLARGGTAAQVLVVGRGSAQFSDDPLRSQLEAAGRRLERTAPVRVTVGGPGPIVQDVDAASSGVVPQLIALLALLTYVALVLILRAPLLALIAVILNLVTVAAVLGALSFAFSGTQLLGGPGFVDDSILVVVLTLVFGLSIDYQVFVLVRMQEAYSSSRQFERSIVTGVGQTAGVITAAAVILATVFVAFAIPPTTATRELSVGLIVGVLIDATVVRLVLLPATMRLAGPRAWWSPAALERRPREGAS